MAIKMRYSDDVGMMESSDRTSVLICPRCGANSLRHIGATVFDRREDADSVVKTKVSGGTVEVDPRASGAGNPSTRRDGIVIDFVCEECGDETMQLTIAQHKGSTEVGWRYEVYEPD